jgi:Flp pilus assembly protein CpaB
MRWYWYQHWWVRWNALVLLILCALVYAGSRSDDGPAGPTALATVAVRDLAVGATIAADDVERRRVTAPERFGGAVLVDDPVGRVVTAAIVAGEPVVEQRVAPEGLSAVAALVPPGHRAVALPVTLAPLPVAVGDRVDVLVAEAEGLFSTEVAARNALVVATSEEMVTIALEEAGARVVADGLASGVVTLTLRGAPG